MQTCCLVKGLAQRDRDFRSVTFILMAGDDFQIFLIFPSFHDNLLLEI